MSGIAGLLSFDGRAVDQDALHRMGVRINHRGPDDSGVWSDGRCGLLYRRFDTGEPVGFESLPLAHDALAITADARIDNRDELTAALGLTGADRNVSDGEIILRAYEAWGDDAPARLVGDFAFAIWDARRERLFCARDAIGVRPFVYHHAPGRFTFASEIKALLELPDIPRALNEHRVADYLTGFFQDTSSTFYRDILRLPPAHLLVVDRTGMTLRRYWRLDPSRALPPASDKEYAAQFREIFTEAVRCRLRGASPVGAMLSGGLDSSSIVGIARSLLGGSMPLHTYSAVFDGMPQCNERAHVERVLAIGGLAPHYLHADRLSPLAQIEGMMEYEDEPFFAPNLFIHWGLYGLREESGARILLDGFDGDATVSHGLALLPELARRGRWRALAAEVRGLSEQTGVSSRAIFWRRVAKPLVPGSVRRTWQILSRRERTGRLRGLLAPDFARRIDYDDHVRALTADRSGPVRSAREHHWRRLTSGMLPFTLEVLDRAAAAHQVEPRYPFFDRRLVEFCLALPAEQKVHRGWTRAVLRRAMEGVIPEEIRWRRDKGDPGPNFNRNLLAFERDRIERTLFSGESPVEPFVDMTVLRESYERYRAHGHGADAMTVWNALTLALWLERGGHTTSQ